MKVETCLILSWAELPKEIKEVIKEWVGFNNDCLLPIRSEFDNPNEITMNEINDYFIEQQNNGEHSCKATTIEDFITEYNLEFEAWIIEQNFQLDKIDKILIDIQW